MGKKSKYWLFNPRKTGKMWFEISEKINKQMSQNEMLKCDWKNEVI